MIRCVHCGFENPPNYRFCQNCGTSLESVHPDHQLDPDLSTLDLSQISNQIPDDIPPDLVEQADLEASPEQQGELIAGIAAEDFMETTIDQTEVEETEITKVIQPKPKVQLKHLAHAGLTDVGQSRDHNEDDFVILSQGFYRQ
ncbi:MAG: zinc-ribbon domain-containing protein, partial [Pseudanabaenaceae cyanobacterium bins.68]|nr:zinc-ribbon domain-containing protein [Pseudanabaenaceae cyanobacterium bins.68]